MARRALKNALTSLEAALESPEDLGPDDRETLLRLQADIERALDATEERDDQGRDSIVSEAQDIVRRFSTDHPVMAAVLGRLADALSAMGV